MHKQRLIPGAVAASLLACAFVGAAAAGERPANDPNGAPIPWRNDIGTEGAPLREIWTSALGGAVGSELFLPPVESERPPDWNVPGWTTPKHVYYTTTDHRFGALQRVGGEIAWQMSLPGPILERPAFTATAVYFISGQQLFGLERHSGQLLFKLPLPFAPGGGPVAIPGGGREDDARQSNNPDDVNAVPVDDSLIIAGFDDVLRRVEIVTNEWPQEVTRQFRSVTDDMRMVEKQLVVKWAQRFSHHGFPTGQLMKGSGSTVLMALSIPERNTGFLCAWDMDVMFAGRPKELISIRAQRPIETTPVLAEEVVLMPSLDGNLYAVLAESNSLLWKHAAGDALTRPPQYLEDIDGINPPLVMQKCGKRGRMLALSHEDGRMKWENPIARVLVARMEDSDSEPARKTYVVAQNEDGTLSGLRMGEGEEMWRSVYPEANARFCPNAREDLVYVLVEGGKSVRAFEHVP